MAIQAALSFFHAVRQSPELQVQVAAMERTATETQLVELAQQAGFACTAAEIQAAFRHEWIMRWLHHTSRHAQDFEQVRCQE